ncbi:MAG: hypothetical protein M0Q95_18585 [Porticoccaceae bacterium]|nr:hypothetical protein [Porticoccaceae bacterium]
MVDRPPLRHSNTDSSHLERASPVDNNRRKFMTSAGRLSVLNGRDVRADGASSA